MSNSSTTTHSKGKCPNFDPETKEPHRPGGSCPSYNSPKGCPYVQFYLFCLCFMFGCSTLTVFYHAIGLKLISTLPTFMHIPVILLDEPRYLYLNLTPVVVLRFWSTRTCGFSRCDSAVMPILGRMNGTRIAIITTLFHIRILRPEPRKAV
jgi:hypothetical protein